MVKLTRFLRFSSELKQKQVLGQKLYKDKDFLTFFEFSSTSPGRRNSDPVFYCIKVS